MATIRLSGVFPGLECIDTRPISLNILPVGSSGSVSTEGIGR